MTARGGIAAACVLVAGAICLALAPGAAAQSKPVWVCKPGLQSNPCEPGLDTTQLSPSGEQLGIDDVKAPKRPPVDCFYVYPTVSDEQGPNASLDIDPEIRSIALYQAARYSQVCRVFAPVYRQFTLSALFNDQVTEEVRALAYSDVLAAWRAYLKKESDGRGVVFIGHSQGTFMLRQLVREEIDPKAKLRRKLVSAILLGGDVEVQDGEDSGGDFRRVAACRSRKQLGCVVAFSVFNAPVPPDAIFGRATVPGREVLCTNPASLGGGPGPLEAIYPSEPFAPGTTIGVASDLVGFSRPPISTPWAEYEGAFSGECSSADGADVLQIAGAPGAPALNAIPDATWGLHLVDANIALGNLVELVRKQAKAFTSKRG